MKPDDGMPSTEREVLRGRLPRGEVPLEMLSPAHHWRGLAPPAEDFWPRLGFLFAFAGAAYLPLVMSFWLLVIAVLDPAAVALNFSDPASLASAVAQFLAGVTVLAAIGFAYCGLLALTSLPILVNLARLASTETWPATRAGSVLAAVATIPLAALVLRDARDVDGEFLLAWLAHLAVAIGMGQMAGLVAAVRSLRRRRTQRRRKPRWGLRQLLVAMAGVSLALALLEWLRLLDLAVLLSLVVAVGTHLLATRPLTWLVNRWADHRLERRRAIRLAGRPT